MGLLAIGRRAFGFSSGLAVKVGNELPGPHRIKAWRPGVAIVTAWGILKTALRGTGCRRRYYFAQSGDTGILMSGIYVDEETTALRGIEARTRAVSLSSIFVKVVNCLVRISIS